MGDSIPVSSLPGLAEYLFRVPGAGPVYVLRVAKFDYLSRYLSNYDAFPSGQYTDRHPTESDSKVPSTSLWGILLLLLLISRLRVMESPRCGI